MGSGSRRPGHTERSATNSACGEHLADCFGLPEPGLHIQRTLQRGTLAVSELKGRYTTAEPSDCSVTTRPSWWASSSATSRVMSTGWTADRAPSSPPWRA